MDERAGRTRANAVITVHKYEPSAYAEPADGPALTRIHVEESFSGDITGDGIVEFLQAARADGSASFVGIERITGELGGRWVGQVFDGPGQPVAAAEGGVEGVQIECDHVAGSAGGGHGWPVVVTGPLVGGR